MRHPSTAFGIGCALLSALAGCAGGAAPSRASDEGARLEELRRSLSILAADSMEGRRAGTTGAAKAARFLAAELRRHGVDPAFPERAADSAYYQNVPLVRGPAPGAISLLRLEAGLDTVPDARRLDDVNVIGLVRGADPRLRDEAVIVGAHFDHIGIGPAVEGDSIYNGADDDASGVVTVLEVARSIASGPPPARTVVFLLTTAEENGLLGTLHYLNDPVVSLDLTVADLQVEMVGRPDPEAGGAGRAWLTGFERSILGTRLREAGVSIIADPRPAQRFFERSDNIAFACRGIPAHTLSSFGMHTDYHGADDEADRIDYAHLSQVAASATRAVRALADGPRTEWVTGGDPSADTAICG